MTAGEWLLESDILWLHEIMEQVLVERIVEDQQIDELAGLPLYLIIGGFFK